jgi:hypothetical protein
MYEIRSRWMALHELIRAVDELSSEDLEALYIHIH